MLRSSGSRSLPVAIVIACVLTACQHGARSLSSRSDGRDESVRATRVLSSLSPAIDVEGRGPVRWTLDAEMAKSKVPGVSIAVVDGGRIVWSYGRGILQAGGNEPVTTRTLFQAASISKVIAATITLRLVDAGKLDLDTDVNRYLRSWKVPDNAYTERETVNLRRLLSHTAGTGVHGFPGYAADQPKPTLLQVLDGQPPANNKPIRIVAVPGSATRYSGGGIVIEQLVLTDVSGMAFPDLARQLVFKPLAMDDSTFDQPLPDQMRARAARGHDDDGKTIRGGWYIGPEMAAGWMWTSATDLMRWAIAVADARDGRQRSILSQRMATAMLTPQKDLYGLGPLLEGSGRALEFSHGGNNPGYTTQITYLPETRQGVAILTNKVGADLLIDEIMRAVAREYGWPAHQPRRVTPVTLPANDLERIAGTYSLRLTGGGEGMTAHVKVDGGRIFLSAPPIVAHEELVPVSANQLLSATWGFSVELQRNDRGDLTSFTLRYGDTTMNGTRNP